MNAFCDECRAALPPSADREWESDILLNVKIDDDGEWQGTETMNSRTWQLI